MAVAVLAPLIVLGRGQLAALAESHKVAVSAPAPPSVRVAVVAEEVVEAGSSYSAVVKELRRVDLAFRVGGTLEYLLQVEGPGGVMRDVHEGDRVPKGAILARLDEADYRRDRDVSAEKLATAKARLDQLESDAALARIELGRAERLTRRGAGTASDLDASRARALSTAAAVAGARRDVASSEIALKQAEANLGYCTLTAPFEGATIAARAVDNFERVAADQAAFSLLDLSSVVTAFAVPDSLVGRLAPGQPIEVTAEALPGRRFSGVIHKIGSSADPMTRTYPVEVRIDRPDGLRPGMVATAHFRRERRAYLLPMTALTPGPASGSTAVYRVAREDGRDVARRVAIAFDDVLDNRVSVTLGAADGLRPGDRVVAGGVHRLRDGQPVKVVD